MANDSRSNPRPPRGQHSHTNEFVDDLPQGYLKAGIHLFEKAGPVGKILLLAVAAVAAKKLIEKIID